MANKTYTRRRGPVRRQCLSRWASRPPGSPTWRTKMRKKMRKVWGKIRKLLEIWLKNEESGSRAHTILHIFAAQITCSSVYFYGKLSKLLFQWYKSKANSIGQLWISFENHHLSTAWIISFIVHCSNQKCSNRYIY